MSDRHENQGSEQGSSSFGTAYAASRPKSAGPDTVINPSGRPQLAETSTSDNSGGAASSVWNALFPAVGTPLEEIKSPAGLEFGHFRIEDRIRTGGMGAVFRAQDTRLKRTVALKVLPPALSRDPSAVQRFRKEAQAAAQLDHENIARVYFIGEEAGIHFIAFEYIVGTNIREIIQQQRQLDPADAVNFTLQVATALAHTSAKGVVHRDIKPSNIIITPSGRAKLVDLGLARSENRESGDELTAAGTTLGTFDYISPEQAKDPRNVDVRSDIYSLGCTLYHMLAGQAPYPEGTVLQKLLDHQGKDAPDPRARNRRVSEDLAAIVRKMMFSEPRRRYQTAEHLIRDLMVVAGQMGLRSVNSEGLIWMSSGAPRAPFWERHLGWMATVTALFLIVAYLKFYPDPIPGTQLTQEPRVANPTSEMTSEEDDSGVPAVGTVDSLDEGLSEEPIRIPNTEQISVVAIGPGRPEDVSTGDSSSESIGTPPKVVFREFPSNATFFGPEVSQGGLGIEGDLTPVEGELSPRLLDGFPAEVALKPGLAGGADPRNPALTSTGTLPDVPVEPSKEPRNVNPSPVVETLPPISILAQDGATLSEYPTLEAACSAAIDGSVIELRFNGVRREGPIRITKKITIRAAKGYRPVIDLVPVEIPAEGFQTRMITVVSGTLNLSGVNLRLTVRDGISTDLWTIFSVQRPDFIRLREMAMTIVNPNQRVAAVAEFVSGPSRGVVDMELEPGLPRSATEIEISQSFVRGAGDLFQVRNGDPIRFSLKDSLFALDGSLLSSQGTMETLPDNSQLELRLDHVTGIFNHGLAKMTCGELPRMLMPVQISATNNVFSTTRQEAFVAVSGYSAAEDLQRLVQWSGQKNYYDRFQNFWTVNSTDGMGRFSSMDFSGWKRHWGAGGEVDGHPEVVLWKRSWTDIPYWELTPAEFALDDTATDNPAIAIANVGDAGVSSATLGRMYVLPIAPSE